MASFALVRCFLFTCFIPSFPPAVPEKKPKHSRAHPFIPRYTVHCKQNGEWANGAATDGERGWVNCFFSRNCFHTLWHIGWKSGQNSRWNVLKRAEQRYSTSTQHWKLVRLKVRTVRGPFFICSEEWFFFSLSCSLGLDRILKTSNRMSCFCFFFSATRVELVYRSYKGYSSRRVR